MPVPARYATLRPSVFLPPLPPTSPRYAFPQLQVLRTAFPGVRIHDDVISLEKLPEVGKQTSGRGGRVVRILYPLAFPAPLPQHRIVATQRMPLKPLEPPTAPLTVQETELLVAGFPCIDVSRAGLRRGLEGQSTGLVRHVFRLLQASFITIQCQAGTLL